MACEVVMVQPVKYFSNECYKSFSVQRPKILGCFRAGTDVSQTGKDQDTRFLCVYFFL